jgi:hypothetical protein
MKLNFNKLVNFSLLPIILISCSKEVDSDISVPEATPFVTCYLTNESKMIKVFYKDVISINDTLDYKFPDIRDALVNIESEGNIKEMHFDTIEGAYTIDTSIFPIKKGLQYNLSLSRATGEHLYANCIVPANEIPDVTFSHNLKHSYTYNYSYSFNDDENEDKYYLAQVFQYYIRNLNDTTILVLKNILIKKDNDQVTYSGKGEISLQYQHILYPDSVLNFKLLLINKDMYQYFISVAQNIIHDGSNSVVPSPIYSNFNGGNGIFGPVITKL